MAGIDSLVSNRADMFAGNPQGLQQRYAMSQDLLDLLALQKLKKDKEAAQRDLQMQMQAPAATVKDQLAGQVMDMTKQEVASSLAPGIQQQGQAMQAQQLQQAMGGIASQPAPNMVGMARGGIVGYQEGGGPVGDVRRRSGYDIRQAEKEAMRERAGPEMQELMQGVEETIGEGREWVGENPVDALTLALLAGSGVGALPAAGRVGLAGLTKLGPKLVQGARNLYSRPNPAFTSRTSKAGTRLYPAGVPERLFSPGRTAGTAAGLQALSYLFGGEEDGQEDTPSTDTPATQAPGQPTTQLPAPRTGIASGMSAEEAAMQAMDDRAGQYQGTDEDLASMLGEDVAPMQQAQPEAPQDPRLSRSEQRLEELKTEQTDKLGALIEFLLAAGASGGTNLGATLTGGGSGLMARDARIKDEIAKTIQNIETLELEQAKMAQQASQFSRGLSSEEARAAADRASREGIATLDREVERDKIVATLEAAMARAAGAEGLTPANRIRVMEMVEDRFADPAMDERILARLNQMRAQQGVRGQLSGDDLRKPQFKQAFDQVRATMIDEELARTMQQAQGGGAALSPEDMALLQKYGR
jgi:hypothetical protein